MWWAQSDPLFGIGLTNLPNRGGAITPCPPWIRQLCLMSCMTAVLPDVRNSSQMGDNW